MKPGIHPNYVDSVVTCSCGNSWTTRSTKPTLRTDLCSQCHPFFTGEQRIVDTAGQVERFMNKLGSAQEGGAVSKKQVRREQKMAETQPAPSRRNWKRWHRLSMRPPERRRRPPRSNRGAFGQMTKLIAQTA
jgi:large subunit ribosomal protein L31